MNKPLIYIDQNAIGCQMKGQIDLCGGSSEFQWVYSKHHFSEFIDSKKCDEFLDVLENIDAKLIELNLDEYFHPKNSCAVHTSGTPYEHFERYKNAINNINFDIGVLSAPLAWLNGNRDIAAIERHPNELISELDNMLNKLGLQIGDLAEKADFETLIEGHKKNLLKIKEPIEAIRSCFGSKYGFSDYSKKENPLQEIWNVIKDSCPGLNSDQFFGFSSYDGSGVFPKYPAVIGCCAVLDIIGFWSEKKSRKISKVPNIQNDAAHIAYGIFCAGILSNDNRLYERASAIYKYMGVNTVVEKINIDDKPLSLKVS